KPDAKPTAKSAPKLEQKQAQEDGTNETKKESEVKKTFNFEGGDKLSKLGAAWFVSYSYHKNISPEHLNWDQLQTSKSKVTLFKLTSNLHKTWLQNLLNVDESGLTNKIGLKPSQVKVMIKKLLDKN
ncbi:MAG: hypothetical protein LBU60_04630, partial [Clostridiales bacterium]|nr:hypothetical protein [Clostridiales bacterium]